MAAGGRLIKYFRKEMGITQKTLSEKTKIPREIICQLEKAQRPIGELNARRLADFFFCSGFIVHWQEFYYSELRPLK